MKGMNPLPVMTGEEFTERQIRFSCEHFILFSEWFKMKSKDNSANSLNKIDQARVSLEEEFSWFLLDLGWNR